MITVGFVDLGNMGGPMAVNLIDHYTFATKDQTEGIAAFIEKRAPKFPNS